MSRVPSVADLIAHYNQRLPSVRCSLCDRLTMFNCGYFTACLLCDTNAESRKDAQISGWV